MQLESKILSEITTFMKYAKYLPKKQRRETWKELVDRNKAMHLEKFPKLEKEIEAAYEFVYDKKVLPSMRSLQFAGKPIQINNARLYNCCFLPINHTDAFSEVMFLLLSGTGVGYSVQKNHIEQLPPVNKPVKTRRYLVGDSIEGWADAVKMMVEAYMKGKALPLYDFSDVRPKGALLLTSGGKAPGPEPLKDALHNIQKIFDRKQNGQHLTTLEVHDILCFIADAVLSGGIRRSAMISLFDLDDDDMLTCKFGNWWEQNPQRGRSNNSAVIVRHKIEKEVFLDLWKKIEMSGSGEPGFFFTNDPNWGLNPCAEIVKEENARVAEMIGTNKAARTTTVKPEGTSSLVLGTSSGIHAWHNDFYVRRIRVGKNEGIYQYLADNHPEIVEDEFFKPKQQAVISVPQKAPKGAITRQESALDLLGRTSKVWKEWVKAGHRKGENKNNVSVTVTIKPDEWVGVGEWMWDNRENFTALSVLPYSDHSYMQAPFEDITEEQYKEMVGHLHKIDLTKVVEVEDNTDLAGEVACGGGGCEVQ